MKKSVVSKVLISTAFILAVAIGVCFGTFLNRTSANNKLNILADGDSETIQNEAKTDEQIVGELNQKVADGMINISMNLTPKFASGSSEGNLLIVNNDTNKYPQFVKITRDDTGEAIYTSGGIAVGNCVKNACLDVALPSGTYECTALFTQYEESTQEPKGQAAAKVLITVLK